MAMSQGWVPQRGEIATVTVDGRTSPVIHHDFRVGDEVEVKEISQPMAGDSSVRCVRLRDGLSQVIKLTDIAPRGGGFAGSQTQLNPYISFGSISDPYTNVTPLSVGSMQQAYASLASLSQTQTPKPKPRKKAVKKDKFTVGTTVKLNKRSSFYDQSEGNNGTIVESCDSGYWRITWEHGYTDNYPEDDLILVQTTKDKAISLETVIISEAKKEEIKAAISQVEHNDLIFTKWGFSSVFEKGTAISLLFYGIPGTGKTLTAQAIADTIGATLKVYGTAEIESQEPGGAERKMQEIFALAKKANKTDKKTVLLFDECDSLLTDRNELGAILGAQVNCLLGEIEKYDGVIIFTTNRLGKLDPALERRITAKIEFEFPDEKARQKIWERMIPKKAPLDKDVSLEELAKHAVAGGNIKNAVLNAARAAAYTGSKTLTQKHFVNAIEKEAASLQAFVSAYEKTSHQSLAGYAARGSHGITVSKEHVKTQEADIISKWGGGNK